ISGTNRSFQINNLANPSYPQDAATKFYVDTYSLNVNANIFPSGGSFSMIVTGNCIGWDNGYANSGIKWINNSSASQTSSFMMDGIGRFKVYETNGVILAFV